MPRCVRCGYCVSLFTDALNKEEWYVCNHCGHVGWIRTKPVEEEDADQCPE